MDRSKTMARIRQDAPLTMGWCLDCHRKVGPSTRAPPPGVRQPRVGRRAVPRARLRDSATCERRTAFWKSVDDLRADRPRSRPADCFAGQRAATGPPRPPRGRDLLTMAGFSSPPRRPGPARAGASRRRFPS
jgi:hypothetical protein